MEIILNIYRITFVILNLFLLAQVTQFDNITLTFKNIKIKDMCFKTNFELKIVILKISKAFAYVDFTLISSKL